MTQSFIDMLYLFKCATHGIIPEERKEIDLDLVFKNALEQGTLPMIILSLTKLNYDPNIMILGITLENHIKRIRLQVLNNLQRSVIVYNAIKELEVNGISCCVLKGDTLAGLYKNPEYRISNDVDIYIGSESVQKKAIKILKKLGFEFFGGPSHLHHFSLYHEVAGQLELHRHLFIRTTHKRWFESDTSQNEPYRIVETHYGSLIPTLGITDCFIYMYIHIVKHFLNRGIGIRPIMDILLYIREYKDAIKIERFYNIIRELKYDRFFDNMIFIGVKYLGFSEEELFPYTCTEATAEKVLADIEGGGIFGARTEWRRSFSKAYTDQRILRVVEEADDEYMKKWTKNPIKRFFISRQSMLKEFPYLAKHRVLLPLAWLLRAVKLVKKAFVAKDDSDDYVHSDEVKERMELIKELDMI